MTGPEHYRRAEVLLESCQAGEPDYDPDGTPVEGYGTVLEDALGDGDAVDTCRNALMAAQVHATLAAAAASAAEVVRGQTYKAHDDAWHDVAGFASKVDPHDPWGAKS